MLKGVFDEVWLATGDQNSSAYDQHRATAACLLSDTGADRRIRGENEPAARDWCGVQVCHHGVSDLFYLELS